MDYYIKELETILSALPKGYISRKIIQGKERFYYQWREDGKVKSRYIKEDELEGLRAQIEERHRLKEELEMVKGFDRRIAAYARRFYMSRKVPIGEQSYERLISEKLFYVDKTRFIQEWWSRKDSVTLITRPRRFGKTLNMSMVECFFSTRYENRSDLFEGLYIWSQEYYRQQQGAWPVISLSFGDVKNMETAQSSVVWNISVVYRMHYYLLESERLTEREKEKFQANCFPENTDDPGNLIQFLCELLYKHFGKKVIFLLDEYDAPLQEAYAADCWEEMASYMRKLFNSALKNNAYLEKALLTGITRVSKESLFSDLNHLCVATVTTPLYETAFGFTGQEVSEALEEQHMGDEKTRQMIKKWYDGFRIGNVSEIYNPWSIIYFLRDKQFKGYWANTSSHKLLGRLLGKAEAEVKQDLERLVNRESIEISLDEEIIFPQLDYDDNSIWSLMVASGYLKIVEKYTPDSSETDDEDETEERYRVAITNLETVHAVRKLIRQWFTGRGGYYNAFIRYLLRDDLEGMNGYMSDLLIATFSVFDVPGRKEDVRQPERFYHGFVLGLMIDLQKEYEIRSNRESGYGRYDIMLIPRNLQDESRNAYILEFKLFQPRTEKKLEDTVARARQQITEKAYEAELIDRGIPAHRIRAYGFGFRGKEVLIG